MSGSSRTDVGQTFEKRKLNKSSTFVKCYKLAPFYESMSYGSIVKRSTQSMAKKFFNEWHPKFNGYTEYSKIDGENQKVQRPTAVHSEL